MALMALARGFFLIACFPVRVCSDCAAGPAGSASGGPFRSGRAGPWPGAAGGGSGGPGRSRQSQTGALVPYARGTLRLQHVTFFNWCEPPMGASLSVSMGLISPERRNLFPGRAGAPRCHPGPAYGVGASVVRRGSEAVQRFCGEPGRAGVEQRPCVGGLARQGAVIDAALDDLDGHAGEVAAVQRSEPGMEPECPVERGDVSGVGPHGVGGKPVWLAGRPRCRMSLRASVGGFPGLCALRTGCRPPDGFGAVLRRFFGQRKCTTPSPAWRGG